MGFLIHVGWLFGISEPSTVLGFRIGFFLMGFFDGVLMGLFDGVLMFFVCAFLIRFHMDFIFKGFC